MNYTKADELLQGRCKERRKVDHNTYLERRAEGRIALRLHQTDIMVFLQNGDIILDSGGWRTVTTKDRWKKHLEGFRIYSNRGILYLNPLQDGVFQETPRYVFEDGMVIKPDGSIEGAGVDNAKEQRSLKRKARAYAKNFAAALQAGQVPAPSNGDCWFCLFRTTETPTQTWGEMSRAHGSEDRHIQSHIEEPYYVPSLAVRALETFGGSPVERMALAAAFKQSPSNGDATAQNIMEKMHGGNSFLAIGFEQLERHIYRYVCRQLGFAS